jgi:hypothetical protein
MKAHVLTILLIASASVACSKRMEPAPNFESIESLVSSGFSQSYYLLVSREGVVTPSIDLRESRRPCVRPIEREELTLLLQLIAQVPLSGPQVNTLGISASLMDGERVALRVRASARNWDVTYPTQYANRPIPLWVLALGNTMVELRRKYAACERADVPSTPSAPG